ncbi:MAG: AAA family ATPase [Kofleriaceae bacterium]|nr:AAA family ATPase [Kofleriaceae bacterium]
MRILAIRGGNLASLAREFEIDLAGGALAGAGLFAIVGETGAGKSTLLDAICAALFDATPRLGGRSQVMIGRGDDDLLKLGASDVRTLLRRGATGGFAEVDFEGTDGRRYRARWQVWRARRSRSGRLQDQQMTLTCVDTGERLGGTRTETLVAIRAKLGLSFDQFRRSALLAQGEFAAFLRAGAAERADLLERMTGTEIYGELSMRAFRRRAEREAELAAIQQRRDAIAVMDDDTRAAAGEAIAASEVAHAEAVARHDALAAAARWAEQAQQHGAGVDGAQAEQARAEAMAAGAAPMRAQLVLADALTALRPRWEAAQRSADAARAAVVDAERAAVAAARLQGERVRAEVVLGEAASRADHARGLRVAAQLAAADHAVIDLGDDWAELRRDLDDAGRWLATHAGLAAVAAAWPQLQRLVGRVRQAERDVAQARRSQSALADGRMALDAALARADADERSARQAVQRASEEAGRFEEARRKVPLDGARRRLEQLEHERQAVGELARVVERATRAAADGAAATARLAATEAELGVLAQAQAAQGERLAAARAGEAEVARQLRQLEAALDLSHRRGELVDGEPCPLCGAGEHPWAGGGGVVDELLVTTRARAIELRAEVEATLAQAAASAEQADRLTLEREAASAAAAAAIQAGVETGPAFAAALAGVGELPWLTDPASAEARALVAQRQAAVSESWARADDTRRTAEAADRAADQARQVVVACQNDLTTVMNHRARATRERHDGELRAAEISATIAELDGVLATAAQQWRELVAPWPGASTLEPGRPGDEHQLEGMVDTWRRRAALVQSAEVVLTGRRERDRAEHAVRSQAATAAVAAAAAAAAAATAAQDQARTDAASVEQALAEAGVAAGEATVVLALPPDWADGARRRLTELDQAVATAGAVLAERVAQRAAHHALAPALVRAARDGGGADADLRQALPAALAAAAAARDGAARAIAEAVVSVQRDDEARRRRAAIAAELTAAEDAAGPDRQLAALIGSHDGKALRAFAQSLTLEALLAVANSHLARLAPRYQLERVPSHDLELQIIDRDLGDEVRSAHSLSGGESFLVSLALALALSSVSARNVRVRTLLIDEGFGTLDPAALDSALSVLDELQRSGCQVGIISHVPGLKERVGAYVEVKKRGEGQSEVTVRAAS